MTRLIVSLASLVLLAAADVPAGWNLDTFRSQSTLEFYTVDANGEGNWATVWVVVIDGAPYLRLGSRATARIENNANKPIVKIRIAGQEFDQVKAEPAPEMVERVAAAMGDKYTTDLFVRYASHPLTVRLLAAAAQAQPETTSPSPS